jgi:hypothetical protein
MQWMPEFVRDDEPLKSEVRLAIEAILTGWETVVFQVVDEPEPPDSESATAAFAP